MIKRPLAFAIGVVLMGLSGVAGAITDTETNAAIPFNLANPGARSMGMGGAFLGLADDATAAYTNPAGLTQLVTPEISIEGRYTDYSIPFVTSGSASISPFDASGVNTADAGSSRSNLSFLSFVYPYKNWSFAFYRDELVRYHSSYSSDPDGVNIGDLYQTFPVNTNADLKIINYGVSAAWKASDNVSLGIGLSYYDFNIDTLITRSTFANAFPGVPAGFPLSQQSQHGSDNDVGVNLGGRFVLSEHWSAGVVYRKGPKFSYDAANALVASIVDNGDGTFTGTSTSPEVVVNLTDVKFKVPDEFGGGLSWHPNENWVINFDADFIQYSQLTHGIESLFGNSPATTSQLSIPNGTEYHLGGEYTFTQMEHPFSLRAGVWHDPRHSIEFKGDPGTELAPLALATLFSGGKGSQTHGSIGAGWAFSKFQLDAAADFSDLADTYSLSAVYHF